MCWFESTKERNIHTSHDTIAAHDMKNGIRKETEREGEKNGTGKERKGKLIRKRERRLRRGKNNWHIVMKEVRAKQ